MDDIAERRPKPAVPGASVYIRTCGSITSTKTRLLKSIMATFTWLYQITVVEFFLRRKHIETSKDGRHIPLRINLENPLIDTRRGHAYISNDIRTSRYTVWDFIPKQLFFQFSRVANFYFLCVGIPQMIPGLSTTGTYTTILPLLFFVIVTMFKEGYDDYKRHRLDKVENANFATILGPEIVHSHQERDHSPRLLERIPYFKKQHNEKPQPVIDETFDGVRWNPTRWSDIKVGNILRLSRDEPVPADIILIHSDGEEGVAFIETMALDGETNLKSKQVCPIFRDCDTISGISCCNAELVVEDPNPDLHNFNGRVTAGEKTMPLTINEVVYRGSVLRNTTCAIGIVINTGEECKIRINSNQHPKAKKPALEMINNKIVVTLAFYVIILSVGVSMGYVQWSDGYEKHAWYLNQAKVPFHQIIIAFIIMFNNVIPLSLYVTLEIVKVGQLLMLNSDLGMYHQETDTPARCNTNTILENLGQVGYIFSDKTGTLTDNIMKFRKISIAGTVWLHEMDLHQNTSSQDNEESTDEKSSGTSMSELEYKQGPITLVVPTDGFEESESPAPLPSRPSVSGRPSMGRRSSSQWRSTGRPDHSQPEVNTQDLLEYIRLRPRSAFAAKVREYFLAVALCHTCLPEHQNGKVEYQAASPDELALVRAAQELGYAVIQRNSQSINLRLSGTQSQEEDVTFKILDIIEFSSTRKRMSIILRYPDGRIAIICKGADSAILPRLKLSTLALQKANEVRQSADIQHERHRRSEYRQARISLGGARQSLTIRRNPAVSIDRQRPHGSRSKSFEVGHMLRRFSSDRSRLPQSATSRGVSFDGQHGTYLHAPPHSPGPVPERFEFLQDQSMYDESEVFSRCFQHLDEFATEGLRTLLYAQRFISESDYQAWKKIYQEATTSLHNRQEKIEAAGEMVEQSFDLVGATAIEDKLQKGVPDTIDRLRRANIKIWMLTGDKRETAINIAHSARISRPGSDIYILDATKGTLESQLAALNEDLCAGSIHSVVVVDGQTLAVMEKSTDLSGQFYSIMLLVDSVICCRASPAQKALLVRTVRSQLKRLKGKEGRGLTLAIGDGANDLAMIQASHVGVGISGREGLQAARVADYSIAQFKYLQRLLFVHGRWNYVRTAKFILCTYWKEMFFYIPTASYQRYNGYTGTSLYEATSLTVFNTLFTSLCTICMGVWEQDLRADTLLAVPELYKFGQQNMGLNIWNYTRWMLLAAAEGLICWYGVWSGYGWVVPQGRDNALYPLGQLVFTVGVLWINWKLFIFETHFKPKIVMACFCITTWGWFAWNAFLSSVYQKHPSGPYAIRDSFTQTFGRDATWWATMFLVLSFLGLLELTGKALYRNLRVAGLWKWPLLIKSKVAAEEDNKPDEWVLEIWQELEKKPCVREHLRKMARDGDDDYDDDEDDDDEEEEEGERDTTEGQGKSTMSSGIRRIKQMIPGKGMV